MLLKYALDQDWEVVDIYSDDDYSGAGVERPDFNRLIKSGTDFGSTLFCINRNERKFLFDFLVSLY